MKPSLEERCAELKARLLAKQPSAKTVPVVARAMATSAQRPSLRATPGPHETPAVSLANPHALVKAALSGSKEVREDYGKLQFRRWGFVDIRVSKSSMRRALKIVDILIKRLEHDGLKVQIATRERGYYESYHQETYVTDDRERVQITVAEKTYRRDNPNWDQEKRYSADRYHYHPSGILTLALDEDSHWGFGCRCRWSDARGHHIEEHINKAVESIHQALKSKYDDRIKADEKKRHELEHQRLRAEAQRQDKEETERLEQLRSWEQAWSECERLRAFVNRWEQVVEAEHGQIESGSSHDAWRRWAYLAIDHIDPLRD
jgi:septin family protein